VTDEAAKEASSDETAVVAIARSLHRAFFEAVYQREPTHPYDALERSNFDAASGLWRSVARAAMRLGARPKPADRRARLDELLGVDSTNYLGTGLTLRELMQLTNAEKIAASWTLQSREEKRRRLAAVTHLVVELERIRETTQSATRLAEMAIECVIEGDWKMIEEWADHFSFEDEHDGPGSKNAIAYATFRELLLQVLRTEKEDLV
jgi:hypothetical protein